jgi:hypothetical protein
MLLNSAIIVIAVLAIAALGFLLSRANEKLRSVEAQRVLAAQQLDSFQKKLNDIQFQTEVAIQAEQEKTKAAMLQRFSIASPDFLNSLSSIAEKPHLRFAIECTHREIYEAAIMADSQDLILSAIGKGKGLRLFEMKLQHPERLFDSEAKAEAENAEV